MARGLRTATPAAEVIELPTADGGEGTVDMLLEIGFAPVRREVTGPLGNPIIAMYVRRGATAVIEMAAAAGLSTLGRPASRATALQAFTRGVGELIRDALDRGHTRIVVTGGGSATTDGGQVLLRRWGCASTQLRASRYPRVANGCSRSVGSIPPDWIRALTTSNSSSRVTWTAHSPVPLGRRRCSVPKRVPPQLIWQPWKGRCTDGPTSSAMPLGSTCATSRAPGQPVDLRSVWLPSCMPTSPRHRSSYFSSWDSSTSPVLQTW